MRQTSLDDKCVLAKENYMFLQKRTSLITLLTVTGAYVIYFNLYIMPININLHLIHLSFSVLEDMPKTGYACEGYTLTIQCNEGKRISILRANYGRFKTDICNTGEDSVRDWSTDCISTRSLTIVLNM